MGRVVLDSRPDSELESGPVATGREPEKSACARRASLWLGIRVSWAWHEQGGPLPGMSLRCTGSRAQQHTVSSGPYLS